MTNRKHSKASTNLMSEDGSDLELEGENRDMVFDDEFSIRSGTQTNSNSSTGEDINKHIMDVGNTTRRTMVAAFMVVLVGAAAAAGFLYMGITAEQEDNRELFERHAIDMAKEVDGTWDDYESAASWVHSACRNWREDNFTYDDFEAVYHYLRDGGLDFYTINWVPNVTHTERQQIEQVEGAYWKNNIPGAEGYTGFTGQEPDPDNPGDLIYANRSQQDFYYPIYVSVVFALFLVALLVVSYTV